MEFGLMDNCMEDSTDPMRIENIEHWISRPGDRMYKIDFTHGAESHSMLCAIDDDGTYRQSHNRPLDATSEMDELVMEDMAERLVKTLEKATLMEE